jgi:hypothetical protein
MIIDVCTTAMCRPKLVEKTYQSFTDNLKGVDWKNSTLYVNIDPFPHDDGPEWEEMKKKAVQLIKMAETYFGTVKARCPKVPNYTSAYAWIWGNATQKIILNLEDDWALNREVDIMELVESFEQCKTLYEVVLRAYNYHYPCTCTSPALLHRRYYGKVASKFDTLRNPETQTHSREDLGIFIPNKKNCRGESIKNYVRVWPVRWEQDLKLFSTSKEFIAVDDIGREWLDNSPYMRPQMLDADDPRYKKKAKFTSWIKRQGWGRKETMDFIKGC